MKERIAGARGSLLAVIPLLMAAAAAAQIAAFGQGIIVWDSIRQYKQALSGHYDDWHPPAMNWLWRQLLWFGSGPQPMFVLQTLLYWSGFALLAWAAARRGRPVLAVALAACALLPIPLFLVGTILKDSLMGGALLLATGLLAVRRPTDHILRLLAIALLLAAATLRFNAVPACLPLLVALLPVRWRNTPRRLGLAIFGAALPLVAAMPLANTLLHAERSGVELSLVIYDMGGITKHGGVDVFPPQAVADPVAVNAGCYTPVSWDRYAWWGDDPCAIGFDTVRAALKSRGTSPYRLWAEAIARHPLAYAAHRLGHFNDNIRFLVHDDTLPTLSLQSDPNPWGYRVLPDGLRDRLAAIAVASLKTPIGWPVLWLAIGLSILILAPWGEGRSGTGLILPITLSALLYGFSYLPLSVASEVRYHVWTMSAVAIAACLTASEIAYGVRPARWRLAVAGALPSVILLLCLIARATG